MNITVFKVDGNNNECWIIEIDPISVCMADGISLNPDNLLKFAFIFVGTLRERHIQREVGTERERVRG